jgi:hypothetical protein
METINFHTEHPNDKAQTTQNDVTHHYKAAVCLEGEKLQRRFSATFKRSDIVILFGVLYSIITLQVVNIGQHRVQHSTSLGTMEDQRLLAGLNLPKFDQKPDMRFSHKETYVMFPFSVSYSVQGSKYGGLHNTYTGKLT